MIITVAESANRHLVQSLWGIINYQWDFWARLFTNKLDLSLANRCWRVSPSSWRSQVSTMTCELKKSNFHPCSGIENFFLPWFAKLLLWQKQTFASTRQQHSSSVSMGTWPLDLFIKPLSSFVCAPANARWMKHEISLSRAYTVESGWMRLENWRGNENLWKTFQFLSNRKCENVKI